MTQEAEPRRIRPPNRNRLKDPAKSSLILMREKEKKLTASTLRALFQYNPKTGFWREVGKRTARVNRRADGWFPGSLAAPGYYRLKVRGISFSIHRLAHLWMTGEWPEHEMDHINGKKGDNRWKNLRQAERHQNQWNTPHTRKSTSKMKGVYFNTFKKRWTTDIRVEKKRWFIGEFKTAEEANAAYKTAAKFLHGKFRWSVG